jgi:hypothetical protein
VILEFIENATQVVSRNATTVHDSGIFPWRAIGKQHPAAYCAFLAGPDQFWAYGNPKTI